MTAGGDPAAADKADRRRKPNRRQAARDAARARSGRDRDPSASVQISGPSRRTSARGWLDAQRCLYSRYGGPEPFIAV